ncbi:1,4-dihydroxy-2-naphthoate octaprenyltransferase [Bifidobacterium sp. SO1]|nr:1,4-dihydroxy-2-naphthoate octaprenyltransferase [Bifidobacterium sp. SO1]MBW3079560.1 1,4-dihydroxy-2-naphthoate octaprenyltransferase [Bifidobacterium simiiventris]
MTGRFWPVAVLCTVVALCLQIAVNFANDYSDGIRGTDDGRSVPESAVASAQSAPQPQASSRSQASAQPINSTDLAASQSQPSSAHSISGARSTSSSGERLHPASAPKPQRLVASGVPPRQVLAAAGIAAAIACVAGLAAILISHAWWLFAVGMLSLLAGWFYTGGRHPYGYAGFGELGVFLFFGLAAVLGTEYALAGTIDLMGVLAAICCGLNAMLLLMVNNLRDIDSDARHGKRTLAVRLGERGARVALTVCVVVDLLLSLAIVAMLWWPWGMILAISGIAVPLRILRSVERHDYRWALADAGYQTLFFAALIVVCVLASGI